MSEDRALEARLELLEKKHDELRRYVDKERVEAQSESVKAKLALGQAQQVLQELVDLFALRPDSSIRTTRHADNEYWEVPAGDLRPILQHAEDVLKGSEIHDWYRVRLDSVRMSMLQQIAQERALDPIHILVEAVDQYLTRCGAESTEEVLRPSEKCPRCGRVWYVTPGAELAYCGHCLEFIRPTAEQEPVKAAETLGAAVAQRVDLCASCGEPYSPTHDASAPGPNVRHPFRPTSAPQPKKPCEDGFKWIGQSWAHCEECSLPAWEHTGMSEPPEDDGSLTAAMEGKWAVRPWKPGEAERMKALHENAAKS